MQQLLEELKTEAPAGSGDCLSYSRTAVNEFANNFINWLFFLNTQER